MLPNYLITILIRLEMLYWKYHISSNKRPPLNKHHPPWLSAPPLDHPKRNKRPGCLFKEVRYVPTSTPCNQNGPPIWVSVPSRVWLILGNWVDGICDICGSTNIRHSLFYVSLAFLLVVTFLRFSRTECFYILPSTIIQIATISQSTIWKKTLIDKTSLLLAV